MESTPGTGEVRPGPGGQGGVPPPQPLLTAVSRPTERGDKSLKTITVNFLSLIRESSNGAVELTDTANKFGIIRRRLYDITNVLDGAGLLKKVTKNRVQWRGPRISSEEDQQAAEAVRKELGKLESEEAELDEALQTLNDEIDSLLECFPNGIPAQAIADVRPSNYILVVQAPKGTELRVPDASAGQAPAFYLHIESPGDPIEVLFVKPQESSTLAVPVRSNPWSMGDGNYRNVTSLVDMAFLAKDDSETPIVDFFLQ